MQMAGVDDHTLRWRARIRRVKQKPTPDPAGSLRHIAYFVLPDRPIAFVARPLANATNASDVKPDQDTRIPRDQVALPSTLSRNSRSGPGPICSVWNLASIKYVSPSNSKLPSICSPTSRIDPFGASANAPKSSFRNLSKAA